MKEADDYAEVGPVLNRLPRPGTRFTGGVVHNQEGVPTAATRHPKVAIIVPPRSSMLYQHGEKLAAALERLGADG